MKVKMYEDYESRHDGRMSKYAQIGGQRDKEKFVQGLVKLAGITSRYVDRANRLMSTGKELYENDYIGDNFKVDGHLPYSSLYIDFFDNRPFLMVDRINVSMSMGGDHFFWLAHDEYGGPFECDLSTNYDDMLNYTNSYGWDNMGESDKKQFLDWITRESNEAESVMSELFSFAEDEMECSTNGAEDGEMWP